MKRKQKIYVESSVISFLTARDSRDVFVYTKQLATREWWSTRSRFDLYISSFVLDEIRKGDVEAAHLREKVAANIKTVPYMQQANKITNQLIERGGVPLNARTDAMHIAMASIHGMDFLLTWNQAHIANPTKMHLVYQIIQDLNLTPPRLVRPDYFTETNHEN